MHFQITWQPWAPLPAVTRDRFAGAEETSRFWILLEGQVCRAWYLGERFLRQTLGLPEQIVPVHPPADMRETERRTTEQMDDFTIGWEETCFRGIGEYRENVQTYLMRPLSGGRRAEGARPVAPAAGAGVGARAGASRRARVRGRGGVQGGRGTGWPALPAVLTFQGQCGATYQISFAPPPADHEFVGVPDVPPVCITAFFNHFIFVYLIVHRILMHLILLQASSASTRQSLVMNASMMGMLQRTFDLLALYSIPVCSSDSGLKPFIHCFT